jgi:hypothetical protein
MIELGSGQGGGVVVKSWRVVRWVATVVGDGCEQRLLVEDVDKSW